MHPLTGDQPNSLLCAAYSRAGALKPLLVSRVAEVATGCSTEGFRENEAHIIPKYVGWLYPYICPPQLRALPIAASASIAAWTMRNP